MWWLALALAQSSDVVRTSAGVQVTHAAALGQSDLDLLLAERMRWRLSPGSRLWIDGAFTVDPDAATTFERSRVRQLGASFSKGAVDVWVGRHAVHRGGPRLVDGVQVLLNPGRTGTATVPWTFGMWGGLAPDLFTTRPELRPGGGPIVAWAGSRAQVSVVGEVLAAQGGIDRVASLAQARLEGGDLWDLSGRVDWQFADPAGTGLSDAAVFLQIRPVDTLRFDAVYNAFSSYRYQQTTLLDPTIQRFAARIDALGLALGVTQEAVDPEIQHLAGLTPRWSTKHLDLSVLSRARLGGDPEDSYLRVQPRLALRGLVDHRLELALDANMVQLDSGWSSSAGPTVMLELAADRSLWLDGSVRGIDDPLYEGFGAYADLFVDWMAPAGFVLMAGGAWDYQPLVDIRDVGVTAFLRVQHNVTRSAPAPK